MKRLATWVMDLLTMAVDHRPRPKRGRYEHCYACARANRERRD